MLRELPRCGKVGRLSFDVQVCVYCAAYMVAHLVEHSPIQRRVAGSIPVLSRKGLPSDLTQLVWVTLESVHVLVAQHFTLNEKNRPRNRLVPARGSFQTFTH